MPQQRCLFSARSFYKCSRIDSGSMFLLLFLFLFLFLFLLLFLFLFLFFCYVLLVFVIFFFTFCVFVPVFYFCFYFTCCVFFLSCFHLKYCLHATSSVDLETGWPGHPPPFWIDVGGSVGAMGPWGAKMGPGMALFNVLVHPLHILHRTLLLLFNGWRRVGFRGQCPVC